MSVLLPLALSLLVPAADTASCELRIEDAWIADAPPAASMRAGYARLSNAGDAPIVLGAVESPDFASVQLHESREENGMTRMRRLDRVEVPAHGSVSFEPNGRHFMLMRPTRALAAGASAHLSIEACGRRFEADFPVRGTEAAHSHDHTHHP